MWRIECRSKVGVCSWETVNHQLDVAVSSYVAHYRDYHNLRPDTPRVIVMKGKWVGVDE